LMSSAFFLLSPPRPPTSPLFPYTTLFRSDLACGCFSFLGIGVHVRPVDSESGIAFGKGQVGLFFGCCGGLTGDGAIFVGINESLQASLGLIGVNGDVAVFVQDLAAPAFHEANGVHGEAFVLLKLSGQTCGAIFECFTRRSELIKGRNLIWCQLSVAEEQLAVSVLRK